MWELGHEYECCDPDAEILGGGGYRQSEFSCRIADDLFAQKTQLEE